MNNEEENDIRQNNVRRYLPPATSRNKLETLLYALEKQPEALPDENERFPFLLRNIGSNDNGVHRLAGHHKKHTSSNTINLFEAISFADGAGYEIYGEGTLLCFGPSHAILGENAFSLLGQSYVEDGSGFNGKEGGVTVNSIHGERI